MQNFLDLIDLVTREEWDVVIEKELQEAGLEAVKFPGHDLPNCRAKRTLNGVLGKWNFCRDEKCYLFWGDVPLATAEVVAANDDCLRGCAPGQWWNEQPDIRKEHAQFADYVDWIDGGKFRTKDEGESDEVKEVMQHEFCHKLVFVDDPSAAGKPFIRTYTFFTQAALNKFVEIAKRHRLDFTYTH